MRRRLLQIGLLLLPLVLPVAQARSQAMHVVLIGGLSGDPAIRQQMLGALGQLRQTMVEQWRVPPDRIAVLTEDSLPSTVPVALGRTGRSTRTEVAAAFLSLSQRVAPGDLLLVVLAGHGSGEGAVSRVNLPGPDATASDYAAWLAPFRSQQLVFVNAATGSGDFLPVLAAPERLVITATRTAMERNASEFLRHLADAVAGDAADGDKDGQLSALELFRTTQAAVVRSYAESNRLQTEHAVISDSVRAARVILSGAPVSTDPALRTLLAERQVLEGELAAWRGRKSALGATEYEAGLERLLLAIAEKTRAIRAAGGGK